MDLSKFQKEGKYLMLAFDHRGSFTKYVNPQNPKMATDAQVIETKKMVIESLQDQFSGVLLDPVWGLPAFAKAMAGKPATEKSKPYLLCMEKTGYEEKGKERVTKLEYSGKQLKKWGASGAKLLVYFNPEAKTCKKQLAITKKAMADARKNDLPFFLEIVTYGNEEMGKSRSEWVLRSLDFFIKNNIIPDVWKLEYPGDALSCKKIAALVGKTPWILLTRGESFDVFKEQLKDAVAAGATGFLAGRALWQEIGRYSTLDEKISYLNQIVKPRFTEISNIVLA